MHFAVVTSFSFPGESQNPVPNPTWRPEWLSDDNYDENTHMAKQTANWNLYLAIKG